MPTINCLRNRGVSDNLISDSLEIFGMPNSSLNSNTVFNCLDTLIGNGHSNWMCHVLKLCFILGNSFAGQFKLFDLERICRKLYFSGALPLPIGVFCSRKKEGDGRV